MSIFKSSAFKLRVFKMTVFFFIELDACKQNP